MKDILAAIRGWQADYTLTLSDMAVRDLTARISNAIRSEIDPSVMSKWVAGDEETRQALILSGETGKYQAAYEHSQREMLLPFDEISIDISTGEHDAGRRAFAEMPPVEIMESKGKRIALFEGRLNDGPSDDLRNAVNKLLSVFTMGMTASCRKEVDDVYKAMKRCPTVRESGWRPMSEFKPDDKDRIYWFWLELADYVNGKYGDMFLPKGPRAEFSRYKGWSANQKATYFMPFYIPEDPTCIEVQEGK